MTYKEIVVQVANQLGLPYNYVNNIYRAYWREIKKYIASLPLKDGLTDEQFEALRPNINIPSLGKLNVTLERYRNKEKHNNQIRALMKEKEEKQ